MRLLFPLLLYCYSVQAAVGLGQLRYLTEEYPPYNFSQEQDQVAGFSVDLLRAVWRETATESQPIELLPWARGYYMLGSRDDVVLFTTTRTPIREPLFQWVCGIGKSEQNLYALKQSSLSLTTLDDAKQMLVATVREDAAEQLLLSQGFDSAMLVRTNSLEQAIKVLSNGRVRLLSINRLSLLETLMREGYDPEILKPLIKVNHSPLCYAFSAKVPTELVRQFQLALDKVLNSEEGMSLRQKYFHGETLLSLP